MRLEPGRTVGAYEIIKRLGEGGMGEVYRARDTRLGRLVAIKLVLSTLHADRDAQERLDREARLASALNHPGIVTIYDIGQVDGRPFIVMELVEGPSLSTRLAQGPLKVREAVDIAWHVADALAAAHGAGIVHRDLKPANVMLTADGRAKIVDFGLSKIAPPAAGAEDSTRRELPLTADHMVLGTAGYMAPEQVVGQPVDFRADQFALGAMVYEMLSGRRPFQRPTAVQTMSSILEDEPPPLRELCPTLSQVLFKVVERCLAKNPNDRYASTRDLAHDLRDARDAVPSSTVTHAPISLPPRRWNKRVVALGVALALVGTLAVLRTQWFTSPRHSAVGRPVPTSLRQIVVLPFTNITKTPSDQVFCDGLVETLTSSLSQLERFQRTLRIVPASEVRGRITSAQEANQAFGATLAISGSVQRNASFITLTLNLIDAVELRQLASRTLTLGPEQELSAQEAVIDVTATLLDLELAPEARTALRAGGTTAAAAYGYYVEGRGYLQRFDRGLENIDRAIDLLSRAIEADARYALAHAALGEAYWRRYEIDRQPAGIDRALDSCRRALTIDERLPTVHVTLAMIARGRGRYEEAIAVAQRGIELDPMSSDAYRELARGYEALKRFDDAERTHQKAVQARPDDWLAYNTLGAFYLTRSRHAEAETAFRRVIELTPDNTRAHNNLGVVYFAMHRHDEAAATWERSMAIRPTSAAASNLGTFYYDRERYAEAARAFERAVTLTPNDHRLWRNLGAALYWAPGQRSEARRAYEEAMRLAEQARAVNPRQPDLLAQLADGYSMLGRTREARENAAAVEQLGPTDASVMFMLAGVYEQVGERARALAWLEKAIAAGYSRDRIDRSPFLSELRKDARYARLSR